MNNLHRIARQFSTKKTGFFWTEVSPKVLEAEYAVRGLVPTLATQMKDKIKKGESSYPFDQVTFCNIGNPQEFHQKPITFFREVISCVVCPSLIDNQAVNVDARKRAKRILDEIISSGSYTHSLGIASVRQSVARFIAKSDSVPQPTIDNIFLTDGASQGVHILFSSLILNHNDSIMIPIPQYPLYTAALTLYGGTPAPYYLDESSGWQLDISELERAVEYTSAQGKTAKAIVVINPGNPTGAIFSADTIKQIIEFSVRNRLVIIADEVYRENIYKENAVFNSFRKVLETMSQQIKDVCQLASLHSVSKGLLGECGMRSGYLYLHNFNPAVIEQLVKLKSINLCSGSLGQIMMDCMVDPPLEGVSKETKEKYQEEVKAIFESLKWRAKLVTEKLNQMKNITSNEVEGAMYAFPTIKFSKKAIAAAAKEGKAPDLFYCLEVLKNTGIALVPGSGFRQKPGTYHFRITTLILPEELLQSKLQALKKYNDSFHEKYAD